MDVVNSTSPKTQDQTPLASVLASVSKSIRALAGLKLADLDLVLGQEQTLLALMRNDGIPVSRLAEALMVRPSTITKTLNQLVKAGFCYRTKSASDARQILLWLTPKGKQTAARARDVLTKLDSDLAQHAEPDRLDSLQADLARVADTLATILRETR